MLSNAVTIELSEMTPHDFLSAYMVLFQTLMTMTVFKSSNNMEVAVLSLQETDDNNLQVLFCVFENLPSGQLVGCCFYANNIFMSAFIKASAVNVSWLPVSLDPITKRIIY